MCYHAKENIMKLIIHTSLPFFFFAKKVNVIKWRFDYKELQFHVQLSLSYEKGRKNMKNPKHLI